jgi:hypothetical protein
MSACRVAVLAGVALASASAEAGDTRVGFAVLAGAEADSRSAVESARTACAEQGLVPLPAGALRAALERPLARDDLARARSRLGAAREAYTRFEYARALTELHAVDRLLVDREPGPRVIELMVERHLLAGLVHEGQRRPADARRDFRLVRRLDPDRRELDAGAYRPQVVALFAEAGGDEGRAGALRIATEPPGARVFVDGRSAGLSPIALDDVAAGRHWVVAAAPGHRARGAIIDVEARVQGRSLSLAPQSPAERAGELRRSLRAASGTGERRAAAAELARAAGVHVLVLVRARAGQVEGAVFDARRGLLSGWLAVPSERFSRRVAAASSPVLTAGADPGAGASLSLEGPAPEADRAPSWYSTWWGRTLIVAGGLAVGGAVFFAASGGDDTYSLSGFCFAEQDC